jgi:hypothetical protein
VRPQLDPLGAVRFFYFFAAGSRNHAGRGSIGSNFGFGESGGGNTTKDRQFKNHQ